MAFEFSIKLMSGDIIPIEIPYHECVFQFSNILPSLSEIYSKVLSCLQEQEIYRGLTKNHIKLFSLNNKYDNPIECLYNDILQSSTIGCYINDIIVYIDHYDYTEYYVNNEPYSWINFVILTNNGATTISAYESNGKFFTDNDIFNIENNTITLIDNTHRYNSIRELFLSFPHFCSLTISHEDVFELAQSEYINDSRGYVQQYEDAMIWDDLLGKSEQTRSLLEARDYEYMNENDGENDEDD